MDNAKRLQNLFGQCLQGAVANKWTAMMDKFLVITCTNITFKEGLKDYLKKIGDMLKCQLCNNGKLAHM
eukprot:2359908-Ditylum_brightwellii.AAC.1